MAITLTGTGGLFTRLGRIGKLIYTANASQAGYPAALDDLFDEFDGDDRLLTPEALAAAVALPVTPVSGFGAFINLAVYVLLRMVQDDNPAAGGSISSAIGEVIRQMKASSDTVKRSTLGATATALTGNEGDGVIVVTTVRGDGLPQENMIAETARVACITDSYSFVADEGAEQFGFYGSVDLNQTRLDYDWPRASGVAVGFTAVSPDRVASNGTLMSNGGFEDFTVANTPDEWTIVVGTAGTDIHQDTSNEYRGSSCLKLTGGSTNHQLKQSVTLVPLVSYAFAIWVKRSTSAAAGQVRIELVDASGSVTTDEAGTSNTVSIDITSTDYDAWKAVTGVFRTPRAIPTTGLFMQIRTNTDISGGVNVFFDNFSLTPVAVPYAGGPGIAVFPGATPFAVGDGWSVALTNNAGGATYGATFQRLFDRLFGMREMGYVLPSDASPTLADSLITS